MPGSQHGPSIKNPKVYDALRRRRGMSKSQAAAISNAMVKKDVGMAIPPTGSNALFNQPGVESYRARRRRKRLKASPNYGARGGQTIIGNLGRGADGRFVGAGGASSRSASSAARKQRAEERRAAREAERAEEEATRTDEDAYIAEGATGRERQRRRAEVAAKRRERAAARRERRRQEAEAERATRAEEDAAEEAKPTGGGGGGGKKKPTPEEKKAEQDRQKAANRAATAPRAGLSADEAETLRAAAEGATGLTMDKLRNLEVLGLTSDGEATDAGRRALNALERGDVRGALAAIQDGKARVARDRARGDAVRKRDAEKRAREAERRAREQEHNQKPAPGRPTPAPLDPVAERQRNRTLANQIIRNLERRRQTRRRGSDRGIGGITNVERQNRSQRKEQRTFGGKPRADLPDSAFAGPDRSFPIVTAQDVKDAARSLGRTRHDRSTVKRGIIRRARAIGATSALPESWREAIKSHQPEYAAPGLRALRRPLDAGDSTSIARFTVFKDAAGRDRWLSITTTAYEDKDAEWITCKAIRGVVAAGDGGAPRGPLRFWHVPGLDLGDCDYQASAFNDRILIESGTFRSKAAARIGQKAARKGYQMSPGFLHSRREPRGGAFDHIALFERSFVPPGRASNPYTRLLTKESRMLTKEKRDEFEALASDAEGRALLAQLLAQAETTVKENDDAGAVYKDAPAWAQALIARLDALEATVKAPMPPEEMIEAGETEAADGAAEIETMDDGAGLLDDDGFAELIVQKLIAAIGPMLELEKKMTGYLGEMKAMLQPSAAKDDARAQELAALQQAGTALEARLKALEGDQPRAARQHYASGVWGDLVGQQTVTKEQAALLATQQAGARPAGLSEAEQGAYTLIFGNS